MLPPLHLLPKARRKRKLLLWHCCCCYRLVPSLEKKRGGRPFILRFYLGLNFYLEIRINPSDKYLRKNPVVCKQFFFFPNYNWFFLRGFLFLIYLSFTCREIRGFKLKKKKVLEFRHKSFIINDRYAKK